MRTHLRRAGFYEYEIAIAPSGKDDCTATVTPRGAPELSNPEPIAQNRDMSEHKSNSLPARGWPVAHEPQRR
jgi:hypothetical protein